MDTNDWTTEEITNVANECCDGLEEILRRNEIDATKPFYVDNKYQILFNEIRKHPAGARVVAISEITGNQIELFVCPVAPPVGPVKDKTTLSYPVKPHERSGRLFASYLSALGQLGSCHPGEVCQNFYVTEREELNPFYDDDSLIDSKNTTISREDYSTKTILSLRAFLKSANAKPVDDEDWWTTEDETLGQDELIVSGLVKKVNRKFGLQNILVNSTQDKIFRSPIDSQTVLLGAPGTGKTTTMTLRLRTKMYEGKDGLPDDEKELLENTLGQGFPKNWILFTPTELLKQYVRNALDNQGLGELNRQMSTWEDFRYDLALHQLELLRTNVKQGAFILNDSHCRLTEFAKNEPIAFYTSFSKFRDQRFIEEFQQIVQALCGSKLDFVVDLGNSLKRVADLETISPIDIIATCHDHRAEFGPTLKTLSQIVDDEILKMHEPCKAKIPGLFQKWRAHLELEKVTGTEDEEGDEDEKDLPKEQVKLSPGGELNSTLKRYCQSVVTSKPIPVTSKTGQRLQLLEKGLPEKKVAAATGATLVIISLIRKLNRAFTTYLKSTSPSYKKFIQTDLSCEHPRWFIKTKAKSNVISGSELDVLILNTLSTLQKLAKDRRMLTRFQEELYSEIRQFSRMMVFVDECTDFSPIQLACMNALTIPTMRSMFASGDLNQRLTSSGIKSEAELQWAIPGADIHRLEIAFRQTHTLHVFGERILELDSENNTQFSQTNKLIIDAGYAPALKDNLGSLAAMAEWTAARIVEMNKHYQGDIPTTAIFVKNRDDVEKFSDLLGNTEAFIDNNLRSQACRDGQAVGSDMKICVYPIEHVKGLEFESCFFIAIDELAEKQPEMFDRYLYVGVTRAAAFLGIACASDLPTKLEVLRPLTVENWAN